MQSAYKALGVQIPWCTNPSVHKERSERDRYAQSANGKSIKRKEQKKGPPHVVRRLGWM